MASPQAVRYRIIVGDWPWKYAFEKSKNGGVAKHYKTHPTLAIADAFPVPDLADPRGCALCSWVTYPMMREYFTLLDAWGFEHKTRLMTWIKTGADGKPIRNGISHYMRNPDEVCMLATRGRRPPRVLRHDVQGLIYAQRREHSRKPDQAYERIQALWDGPYLEVCARQQWPGWDTYGDQSTLFPAQPFLIGDLALESGAA